jgi:transposase-like protein
MARVEVLTGPERRRRWSEEQKRAIVTASFAPGAVVSKVARRADVSAGQIYRWRQELRRGRGVRPGADRVGGEPCRERHDDLRRTSDRGRLWQEGSGADTGLGRGASLLAMILYAKFGEHQPLNRQSDSYARQGIDLDVSTLADWVGACTAALAPLVELIRRHVLAAERIHGDDTTVPVLARGKTITG